MGLAISRKFARAMGGDITVESELGKGSTLRVILSTGNLEGVTFLQPDEVAMLWEESKDAVVTRWRFPGARVLVVDDGAENRELVRLLLEEAGLTVEEAEDGKVGVERAEVSRYDAILMDVHMPVMDGFTAAGILRQKGLKVPIIALTADAMKGFEQKCLDNGYTGYITKPIDVDLFMKMMADLLGGQMVHDSISLSDRSPSAQGVKIMDGEAPEVAFTSTCSSDEALQEGSSALRQVTSSVQQPVVSRLAENPKLRPAIHKFIKRLETKVARMEQAWVRRDLEEIAELAHWLKGAGGTVGYDDFTEPAAELERFAKLRKMDMAGQKIEQVKSLAYAIVPPARDN